MTLRNVATEQNPFAFQWRSACGEGIISIASVKLTAYQPSPYIGLGGISFVAKDPSGSNKNVLGDLAHFLHGREFPYFLIEVVQLVLNRWANEVGLEGFTSVFVGVPGLEILLVVNDRH